MAELMRKTGVAVFVLLMVSGSAFATDGYFSHGYGTKNKGMAGVGAALPLSPLIAATNPAAMLHLGNRSEVSISLFNPNRQYSITGNPSGYQGTFPLTPGTVESGSEVFFIPSFGINRMIDDVSSVGFSLFGNGGMNTDYDTKTFNNPQAPVMQPTGVNLSQLFAAVTYAREVLPGHSFGVTGIVAYQWFEAKGLQAFGGFSTDAAKLSDNGNASSFGYGARVGYMGRIAPRLAIGASYQTKIYMGELDDYAGLFAEQGGFDIPSNWTVGFAVNATQKLTVGADVQQIMYSDIKSIANPMNPANFQNGVMLGSEGGSGFGWEDMTVYKFGAQYAVNDGLSLRAGFAFGEQPIPENEMMFNILAPGVIEQHLTFGASKMLGGREFSIAVMKAFSNSVSGPNPMEAPGQQNIELKMHQWEFEFSVAF